MDAAAVSGARPVRRARLLPRAGFPAVLSAAYRLPIFGGAKRPRGTAAVPLAPVGPGLDSAGDTSTLEDGLLQLPRRPAIADGMQFRDLAAQCMINAKIRPAFGAEDDAVG